MLSAGQSADRPEAETLLEGITSGAVVADKGYDCDRLRDWCDGQEIEPVIPARRNRLKPRQIDRTLYKDRNKVERFFLLLKQYRRVATRYDKTATSFLAFCHSAAIRILFR